MKLVRAVFLSILLVFTYTYSATATDTGYLVVGLDTSGSMRGEALNETISAAEKIVAELGGNRQLEIYSFTRTIELLDNSTDLNSLSSGGYTALYDSIASLTQRAKTLGAPLIILTDGKDSRSLLTITDLLESIKDSPISINFVAYRPTTEASAVLSEIALTTGGQVFDVNQSSELIQVFRQAVVEVDRKSSANQSPIPILIALLAALITLALSALFLSWKRRDAFLGSWGRLLESYEVKRSSEVEFETQNITEGFLHRLYGDTSTLLPKRLNKLQNDLLLIAINFFLISALLLIGFPFLPSLLIGVLIGVLSIRTLVSRAEQKSRREFENELPGALRLIASSLSAGLSFLQALDNFSSDNESSVGREFRRALAEIQMGSPVERALGDIAERMASDDLRWVVFAFSIQREVGGGLAKILQTSAETIDSRASLRQEIRTLSTEGRISSYILMLLPPAIFIFLSIIRPQFISMFWEESIGHLLLLLIVGLMSTAWIWIRRMVTLKA